MQLSIHQVGYMDNVTDEFLYIFYQIFPKYVKYLKMPQKPYFNHFYIQFFVNLDNFFLPKMQYYVSEMVTNVTTLTMYTKYIGEHTN